MADLTVSANIDTLMQAANFAAAKTSQGLGTGDSPQFTAVNVGAATDTTLARDSAGVLAVEGNVIYAVGGQDVAVADGGTGQGSYTDGQLLIGNTTGNTLTKATLTAGSNVTITNGHGSITIASSSGGGGTNTQDEFTGNGATVAFTLTSAPADGVANVSINGLIQTKTTDYSISSATLTFVSAPANASAIQVFYTTPSAGAAGTVTSVSVVTANGVSGSVATSTSTPAITLTLGAIVPTTVNKVTITAPATAATLTLANNKTFTVSNTLTLAGTDSTVMTFPSTSATIARTDAANTFTGTQTIGALVATTVNGNTFTTGTGVLTIAASKTLTASNTLTLAGTDSTTMTFPPASASIGYINIPQNSKSAAYTTVSDDQGKHLYHPSADTTARTFTIDSNANVAYPIGTAITFINDVSAGVLTIAITSDTLVLLPGGTTGSRTLAAGNQATAIKVTSTRWVISGTSGLT